MTGKSMSSTPRGDNVANLEKSRLHSVAVVLAVVLCIVCCTLFLLIPTASINVDTVYQGF